MVLIQRFCVLSQIARALKVNKGIVQTLAKQKEEVEATFKLSSKSPCFNCDKNNITSIDC